MGEIVYGALMPHPPIMVPEIGGEETQKVERTSAAVAKLTSAIAECEPDVLVIITPHGAVFQDAVAINMAPVLEGSFRQFGAPQVRISKKNDLELAKTLTRLSLEKGINVAQLDEDLSREYGVTTQLDHGALVPLYFLDKMGRDLPLVHIAMGFLPLEELYLFGTLLQESIGKLQRRAVVIASGDLSHRLTWDAPAGYHPRGQEYDREVGRLLEAVDVEGFIGMPSDLVEQAGQCGHRPIVILLGALDGYEVKGEVLSYEGPFGVGYMVASLKPQGREEKRRLVNTLFSRRAEKLSRIREKESFAVKLARKALETYLAKGEIMEAPLNVPEEWPQRAGTFVSFKKHGMLRGCMGTLAPTQPSTAQEIIHNAIAAGTRDPRFDPIKLEELDELTCTVDILHPPEKIPDASWLDPRKYGVIVRQGRRAGVLLPDLEGIDTVEEQVAIAKRKAGITGNDFTLERFTVTRYE